MNAIAANSNEVYVGGAFLNAGGKSSPYFAIWHAPPQAPRFSSLSLTPEQNAKLSILGRNGLDCRVEWSSTLTNWTTLITSPNPEGALDELGDRLNEVGDSWVTGSKFFSIDGSQPRRLN